MTDLQSLTELLSSPGRFDAVASPAEGCIPRPFELARDEQWTDSIAVR